MSLKLFRSTGYASILTPGETRVLMHPAWVVVAISLWIGFACNVSLWRALGEGSSALTAALLIGLQLAAAAAVALSALCWRRTLKPAATLVLLIAALAASAAWSRSLPFDASLLSHGAGALLPDWASLLRWQCPALLVVLALVPVLWVWSRELRRVPGPVQLRANIKGVAVALALGAAAVHAIA